MIGFFDRDGKPIDEKQWEELLEDREYSTVARDTYTKRHRNMMTTYEVVVSTVWIGVPMLSWGEPPVIFETMVFGGPHDQYRTSYRTAAEALDGHKVACLMVENDIEVEPGE